MPGGYSGWPHTGGIDWDAVSVEGPKPASPGACELRCFKMEPKESQNRQPMIEAQWEVISHSSDDASVGRKVYDNLVLTQDGAFKVKNYCLATGQDPNEALADVSYDVVKAFCESQLGNTVPAMLKGDIYQGKPRCKVDYYGSEPPVNSTNGNGNSSREAHPARPAAKGKPAGQQRRGR